MVQHQGREHTLASLENRLVPSERMPVLFVGHGNPMNAIEDNTFSRTWTALGQQLPEPQAIVVISAHWLTPGSTRITDAPTNPIIYDFMGFPEELYQVTYETHGDEGVARILADALWEYEAELDKQWGLDHGTWSILKWIAPQPKVPVLQISIDYAMPLPQLYELYSRLRRLRDRGVLFIGSGNIVHALRAMRMDGGVYDWAQEFDALAAEAIVTRDTGVLLNPFESSAAAKLAVPTDDHYRPMVAALSLLDDSEDVAFFNTSIDLGAVGMRSFISV